MTKPRDYGQKEVEELLGVKRATIWRWRTKGLMPLPYDLGPNILYWDRDEFDEWLRTRDTKRIRHVGTGKLTTAPNGEAGAV
jgi:predicted DNA-binding transcriptional regulator AlpA